MALSALAQARLARHCGVIWIEIEKGSACQQTTKLANKVNKRKRTRIRKNTVVTQETGKDQGKIDTTAIQIKIWDKGIDS